MPRYLQRWYGDGTLVGIDKDDQPLDQDARPMVVGETFRRIAGKIALIRGMQKFEWVVEAGASCGRG